MSITKDLLRISVNFKHDDLVVSGDLFTAVDILQTLGQKTAINAAMKQENATQLIEVSMCIESEVAASAIGLLAL